MTTIDRPGDGRVRLYGTPDSAEAYTVRDFLKRSVVEYDWIPVTSATECSEKLGLLAQSALQLPVVELPGGERLFAPTLRDIADRLGWVTQPRLRQYDVSIYGAGPAGLSAAVYAASEGLSVILIERFAVGGQAGSSSLIENYMGFPQGVSGSELAERARQQAVRFGAELLMMHEGVKAEFSDGGIVVDLADGTQMCARSNICATGVEWSRLGLDHEVQFLGRGLFYGAGASEAPMCRGEHVYIVGGGNSAGQAVMNLAQHAERVTMVVRGAELAASLSSYLAQRVLAAPNVDVLYNAEVSALEGDGVLERVQLRDTMSDERTWVTTRRIFICIGGAPHTEWAQETPIVRDISGYLVTGPDLLAERNYPEAWPLDRPPFYLETNVPGSFAAGDVRHNSVKRVASAVGEGAMAVTFVHKFLAGHAR